MKKLLRVQNAENRVGSRVGKQVNCLCSVPLGAKRHTSNLGATSTLVGN